jgi:hypothetical protein
MEAPGDPDPPPEVQAFRNMVATGPKRPPSASQQKFVRKMDSIPTVALPEEETCKAALNLAERGLIGQFMGLWPSPKSVEEWTQRNWKPLTKEGVKSYFVGKGFFVFVFDNTEDRGLIFRNGPFFMGPQGLYLNKWTPDFDPTQDVPSAVPVWVRLPHLPLHCWNQKSLQIIGNALGKYIDQAARKDQYSCARICVEVDLEEGLPEAINLTVAGWTHVQELDYEQLPFKCRHCHGHGHFAKHCKKKAEEQVEKHNGDSWTLVQKNTNTKKGKGKGQMTVSPSSDSNEKEKDAGQKGTVNVQNKHAKQTEENGEQTETSPPAKVGGKELQIEDNQGNPPNPSYAEIAKKNPEESSGSSEDETFERPSKKAGRKSRKEKREEEAERFKIQGSQSTIEMSIGRNTRPRPSKGGPNPPPSSK